MCAVLASTRELLTSLDSLPYRQRLRHVARWARVSADRVEVCADLRGLGAYERHLALVASMVVRDAQGVEAALQDPQPSIKAVALGAAARAGLLGGAEADLSAVERRRIYRLLRRLKASAAADALVAGVRAEYGDDEAAAVLPACSAPVVRSLLPELEHAADIGALMRRHPGLVLERVEARLAAATPEVRDRIWNEVGHALLDGDPATVLGLLERYAPPTRLPMTLAASWPCSPRRTGPPGSGVPDCRLRCCAVWPCYPPTGSSHWPAWSGTTPQRWRRCSTNSRRRGAANCTTARWPR
jgi:hypothetical protein